MSTWDDKPNNYEHAVAEIERLQGIINFTEAARKAEADGFIAVIERQRERLREYQVMEGMGALAQQRVEIERLRALLKDVLDSVAWGSPPSSVKLRIEQELGEAGQGRAATVAEKGE